MASDLYTAGQSHIVRLRDDGYTYRQIAAYLDRKRIAPPRAKSWSAMTVRNIYERSKEAGRG